MTQLHHVTLATGHVRISPRSEVGGGIIETLAPLLERAHHEAVALPGPTACTMTAASEAGGLLVTVWAQVPETAKPEPVPVATIGVAREVESGAALWRLLHDREDLPYATDPNSPPDVPWCAARLDAGAVIRPDTWGWLGDFERCVAWCFLGSHMW